MILPSVPDNPTVAVLLLVIVLLPSVKKKREEAFVDD